MTKTGYVFEERYMWHDPGNIQFSTWLEPIEHWENSHTKRRLHNLICVSGFIDKLIPIKARKASREEILRFHDENYIDQLELDSNRNGGDGGELATFSSGGYDIACLSAGGVLAAVEAVINKTVDNAYCLVRPPGHHAENDKGMGFCLLNNIVLAALHARATSPSILKIAIIDYDVHHGNGTQKAFWDDSNCLFISIHQDNNYPQGSGTLDEVGGTDAIGFNINIPLPPGSGIEAYEYAFDRVVIPALQRFKPDFIFVSSGFDASYADPLGSMMLSSDSYRNFANKLKHVAEQFCDGRIIFAHEGGYSKDYVPFCGIAVIEAISGELSGVHDPYLNEVQSWGYQNLQIHQKILIEKVVEKHGLRTIDIDSSKIQEVELLLSSYDLEDKKAILYQLLNKYV